ncbi:MAG: hypothetical protein HY303_08895 [Candidatus Wallbacteria bacterium]|nr:hypothetical protein [Candidatus Wallbacteria bacterium]
MLDAVLMNTSDELVAGSLELRLPSGFELVSGGTKTAVALRGGETRTQRFVARGDLGVRAVAEAVFRPAGTPLAFSRGRVFLVQRDGAIAGLTTAQAIDAEAVSGPNTFRLARLPGALEAPVPSPDGNAAVKGRLTWYDANGNLAAGRFVTVELVPAAGGQPAAKGLTDQDGNFQISVAGADIAGKSFVPRFTLGNERWLVKKSDKPYTWEAAALTLAGGSVVDAGDLVLPKGLPSSEAAWIHNTISKALDAFTSRSIEIGWWNRIGIEWPADGDYYSWSEVNLTEPHQWDVIGHEFGHAIFFTGTSSQAGGGQHKIDECYSQSLAFSEGWATFFGGVCHLDRGDADAKFQFLVPRRAPIRIENVPADVCMGEKNEWRVSAALWDLYDTHEDGNDKVAYDFDKIWAWMRKGNRMGSLSDFWAVIKKELPAGEIAAARDSMQQSGVTLK